MPGPAPTTSPAGVDWAVPVDDAAPSELERFVDVEDERSRCLSGPADGFVAASEQVDQRTETATQVVGSVLVRLHEGQHGAVRVTVDDPGR